jgi:hypothetical protein
MVMTKFYLMAETEITAPEAGPVQIENAMGILLNGGPRRSASPAPNFAASSEQGFEPSVAVRWLQTGSCCLHDGKGPWCETYRCKQIGDESTGSECRRHNRLLLLDAPPATPPGPASTSTLAIARLLRGASGRV